MVELESDLITLLVIAGFVFLLWIWSFYKELQENNDFFPDGLVLCPPETYTMLDDNISRVTCFSCPVCPAGEEPSPPCGITLAIKVTGECTSCKPGTYSNEVDSAVCKVCTDCGSRKVRSSCSAEKNTECKDCPWRHYEEDATHACKHCFSCCGKRSAAELECFKSKKCRGSCIASTKIKRKQFSPIFLRLVARSKTGLFNTTSMSNFTNPQNADSRENLKLLENMINSKQEGSPHSETKRDINTKVVAQKDYNFNTNSQAEKVFDRKELEDLRFLDMSDITKYAQEQADVPGTEQGKYSFTPSPTKNNLKPDTNILSVENEERFDSQAFPDKSQFNFQPTVFPATTAKTAELGQLTTTAPTAQPQLINASSFLSCFTGAIVAVVLLGLIGLIIYAVFRMCARKMPKGYKKLNDTSGDTSKPEVQQQRKVSDDTNLLDLPPDLEDILVMNLDVPHTDSTVFRWQKVGDAAGIPRNELTYYEHSVGRNGSPTKLLLDKLGSQGRTISYLIDVLQKPKVELSGLAENIIRHRVTRI